MIYITNLYEILPCQIGLVVDASAFHTVGRGFVPRPGHTKDNHTNGTKCPPCIARMCYGISLTVQTDCLKGRVVCGTVYGDMHLKDLQGSTAILSSATWPLLPQKAL